MKDNISLIAAATGGFMLTIACAAIVQGSPVTALPSRNNSAIQVADVQLQQVHPDESINHTLEGRFSLENSLERIEQINSALNSFQLLTQKSQSTLGNKAVSEVGNTDWDTQNLGFTNWVGSVEGTLRKQDYLFKKVAYQLAQKQYEDKDISQAVLNQKAGAYRKAKQEFQTFVNSFKIAD